MGAVTPDYDVAALGAIVRRTRQRMGLSVEALAARSDLSAGLISQLERGRGNPSLQTLSRLAAALGTRLVALLQSAQRRGEPQGRHAVFAVLDIADTGDQQNLRLFPLPDGETLKGAAALLFFHSFANHAPVIEILCHRFGTLCRNRQETNSQESDSG